MIGTIRAAALTPGATFRLMPHQVTGHPGPVGLGHPDMDVQVVDRHPDGWGHVIVSWAAAAAGLVPPSRARERGITVYNLFTPVLLVERPGVTR